MTIPGTGRPRGWTLLVLLAVPCAAAVAVQGPAPSQVDEGRRPEVTLTATPRKARHRILEPVVVDVALRNNSDRSIVIQSAYDPHRTLEVLVSNAKGKEVARTSYYGRHLSQGASRPLAIPAGEEVKYTVIANLASDMMLPGKYRIDISVAYGLAPAGEIDRIADAKSIEVEVKGLPEVD